MSSWKEHFTGGKKEKRKDKKAMDVFLLAINTQKQFTVFGRM